MEVLLCRMLTTMRKHSWQWFGAKSGRIQYKDKSDLIWFHNVFYAKGNSISPSSVSGLSEPTSGCLPLLWATHLTLEICKDNKNLIKMLWKGKNWNNITTPTAWCYKRRRTDVVDSDYTVMEKCFQVVVYKVRAVKCSGVNKRDHWTVNVFSPGRFMHCYIYMASHLARSQGKHLVNLLSLSSSTSRWSVPMSTLLAAI